MRTVFNDGFVLHEHLNKGSREEEEQSCNRDNDGERCFAGKADGVFHTRNISAGVVVADQRHNSLGNTLGNIHWYHVDFLADTHCSNSVRTISGGEVVEDGHASNVEQVLDGSRDADCTDTGDDILFQNKFLWIDADIGASTLYKQQNEEVQAGNTVGEEGCKSGTACTHIQSPWENKERVEDDVEDTSAHGSDAGMQCSTLGTYQICQNNVQDGRNSTEGYSPVHISGGSFGGNTVCTQNGEKRRLEYGACQGEKSTTDQCTVKAEGRTAPDSFIVLAAECTAHHTRAANTKQIVDGVKSKQNRGCKGNSSILYRII